jgi:integrase/recombinase XerD
MSPLAQAVEEYLALRRALGYKLKLHGLLLPQFVEFLERRGASLITTELAVEWATLPTDASSVWRYQRLAMVRGFARYAQALDADHEVPPDGLLPAKCRRAIPYLYSQEEIDALMGAARTLRPALRAATCEAVLGLLAVSGMRVSEVVALDRFDLELSDGRLTVRRGKNGQSREIALHPTTTVALDGYARVRDALCPDPKDLDAFFLNDAGARPTADLVRRWFDRLRHVCGLDRETLGRSARVHDVRHTFVLRTLLRWYHEDSDVQAKMPLLSTFLGHVNPQDTFWYIEHSPELLALAAGRLERRWEKSR